MKAVFDRGYNNKKIFCAKWYVFSERVTYCDMRGVSLLGIVKLVHGSVVTASSGSIQLFACSVDVLERLFFFLIGECVSSDCWLEGDRLDKVRLPCKVSPVHCEELLGLGSTI